MWISRKRWEKIELLVEVLTQSGLMFDEVHRRLDGLYVGQQRMTDALADLNAALDLFGTEIKRLADAQSKETQALINMASMANIRGIDAVAIEASAQRLHAMVDQVRGLADGAQQAANAPVEQPAPDPSPTPVHPDKALFGAPPPDAPPPVPTEAGA